MSDLDALLRDYLTGTATEVATRAADFAALAATTLDAGGTVDRATVQRLAGLASLARGAVRATGIGSRLSVHVPSRLAVMSGSGPFTAKTLWRVHDGLREDVARLS